MAPNELQKTGLSLLCAGLVALGTIYIKKRIRANKKPQFRPMTHSEFVDIDFDSVENGADLDALSVRILMA